MYTLPLKEAIPFKCEYCLSLSVFTAGDELHWGDEIHWPTSTPSKTMLFVHYYDIMATTMLDVVTPALLYLRLEPWHYPT